MFRKIREVKVMFKQSKIKKIKKQLNWIAVLIDDREFQVREKRMSRLEANREIRELEREQIALMAQLRALENR